MSQYANKVCLFPGDFTPVGWLPCDGKNGRPNLAPFTYDIPGSNGQNKQTINYIYRDERFPDEDYDFMVGLIMPYTGENSRRDVINTNFCEGQKIWKAQRMQLHYLLGTKYGGKTDEYSLLPNIPPIISSDKKNTPIRHIIILEGLFPQRP